MNLVEAITLGIALLGAVLGIINTWYALSKDRVRLKVTPAWAFADFGESKQSISIEVLNLGMIPVTVAEVGFRLAGAGNERLVQPDARLTQGGTLPYRLDPRTALTVVFWPTFLAEDKFSEVATAYARTQCGRVINGTSPALRQIVNLMRKDTG